MKTITLLLLILGFTIAFNKANSQTKAIKQFTSYTITIPNGWKESSNTELKEFNELSKQSYDVLLYPEIKVKYDGPPILLVRFKKKEMTKAEFELISTEMLKSFETKLRDYIPSEFSSEVKILKPGQGYYNKKGTYFTYIYEAEIENVGKTYNIITGFYTPHGLLTFQFSDYSKYYLLKIDGFIQLIKSIKK